MLSLVEQAFVERDEKRARLKKPAWEARAPRPWSLFLRRPRSEGIIDPI